MSKSFMLEDLIYKNSNDFFSKMYNYGYEFVDKGDTKLILENKFNKSRFILEINNFNEVSFNFKNKSGKTFLNENWFIGRDNDILVLDDIFTAINNIYFNNFIEDNGLGISKYTKDFIKIPNCMIRHNVLSQTQQKIKSICDKLADLLVYKNKKYGNSAIEPTQIFYKGDNTNSILIRLDDKLSRIKNSQELRVNDICDTLGYLVLLLISKNVDIKEIEKLKD